MGSIKSLKMALLIPMIVLLTLLAACSGTPVIAWFSGVAYNPKSVNPSLTQVEYFLSIDNTCDQTYSTSFTCVNFAHMLQKHAETDGFRCAIVLVNPLNFGDAGHEMDAFQTTDAGLIYVEPQTDEIVPNSLMQEGQPIAGWGGLAGYIGNVEVVFP
jgi:hypothetical protein